MYIIYSRADLFVPMVRCFCAVYFSVHCSVSAYNDADACFVKCCLVLSSTVDRLR